ncbi:MAG: alpha/beta hydrolase [Rhodospirillales bacterium]|nr:alpha/beta hydrolase [Rhodospirillales bacterium]
MHVTEQGEGPPIVFLHGNGATSEDFRISGLLDDLARTHRVIAFDRPGFGFSERTRLRRWHAAAQGALIQAALDQMKIERPILVGHSWGTLVALAMALDAPDRVAGLVLISGFYFAEPRLDVAALLPSTIPGVNDVLRYTLLPPLMRALAGPAYRELFRPASVSARFNEEFPKPIAARPSQLRAIAGDTANLISSARAMQRRYGELSMPVAIVTGNGDRIVDPAVHADRLHAAIAGSSLTRIPGAGHMVHHTARATVLDAITRLAAETEERANARVTPIPASAAFRQAGC